MIYMLRSGIIALYDITGIQDYVYNSNKLKENIGASNLIEKCFDNFFIDSIKNYMVKTGLKLIGLKIWTWSMKIMRIYWEKLYI